MRVHRECARYVRRLPGLVAGAALLALPLAACSDLLEVEDPDVIGEEQLTDTTAIPAIHGSAIATLRIALAGYDGQILYSGLLADELLHSGTFPSRLEIDQRNITPDNATLADVTRNLYRARTAAEDGIRRLTSLGADPNIIGEVQALAGFTYILFAENYCSAIPFSELSEADTIIYGEPNTTSQVLQNYALPRFDAVLNNPEVAGPVLDLARVGKARALLDLGRFEEAATLASQVPVDYVYLLEHSANSSAEYNGIFEMMWDEGRMSSWSLEGENGLPYLESADPRTAVLMLPGDYAFDGETPLNLPLMYQERDEAVVLASGVEAQLIVAEAALRSGNGARMLEILNSLRANALRYLAERQPTYSVTLTENDYPTTLAPIPALPSTPAARVDLLFRERGFWLYLTAHRLGDMRRLMRQYGRAEDTVYPIGEYFRTGGVYGNDVSLRIPIDEENNPFYRNVAEQCISTAAGEETF